MLLKKYRFANAALLPLLWWAASGAALDAAPQPRPKSGRPWQDMDYGPFLTASIEAPQPGTNIAFKGIAIRLVDADGSPGEQNEAIVFDTDLLRYSAGWTGDFVALKGVPFDGEHWAYPQISGDQTFGNPHLPGWAKNGSFADPREFIYGPLPRDWAHWKGLYLHEKKVVLSYTVGDAEVVEMPSLERGAGLTAFSRTIELGKSSQDQTLQIAFDQDTTAKLVALETLQTGPAETAANQSLALLLPREVPPAAIPVDKQALEQGLLARWNFEEGQGNTAMDGSGGNHTLKLRNCLWGPGHDGRALGFGGDGYGQLDQADDIDFIKSDLTFSAWVQSRSDGTIVAMAPAEGPWVPDGKSLFLRDGRLVFDVGWVGAVESQHRVMAGRWTHVAMTWSHQDGTATLFINGLQEAARPLKPRQATRGHVLRIGYTAPNFPQPSFFQGQIDSLRIYGRKLGGPEIQALAGSQTHLGIVAAGVTGAPSTARWVVTDGGHVRLHIPATATPARFKILIGRVAEEGTEQFLQSKGALLDGARSATIAPLTPALSPLREEGDPPGTAGASQVLRSVGAAVTNAARYVVLAETAVRAPSPRNGERAGVRGENGANPPNKTGVRAQPSEDTARSVGVLRRFAQLVKQAAAPRALEPFTHGGPARWGQTVTTKGRLGSDHGPYAIDAITWPNDNPWNSWMRFGGFDFFKDNTRAAICTWSGDVWIVAGIEGNLEHLTWRRFATGLFQPLGLKIVDDQVYVLGRDQITRLHDLNGDGEADFYENFNNDTMATEHFHEFAMDLQADAAGNFYYMKAARHARDALHPQHGTLMKVSKDGSHSEIIAKGFRAPNGLEVAPNGQFYTTDQEGYWMPANRLNLIKPGAFHGNTWSWYPEGKPATFEPPICWVNPRVDRSPSTMAWVTSERWGPLKDKLLSLSYGVGRIFHVMYETVDGVVQGGVTPLSPEFDTGIMRSRFNARDGQFYVCGLFGWAGNKTTPGGFYRVRYTGKPLHLPSELHVATNGVVLAFTDPLDPAAATDVGNYNVEIWNYRWTENYGSPDFKLNGEKGHDRLPVKSVHLSRDGRTVFLELPGICRVMQMNIQMNLKAAEGAPVQTYIHNTIHVLGHRAGEEWLGEQALASAPQAQEQLTHEATGLKQTFLSRTPLVGKGSDARVARLAALYVPAGTPSTPFLLPGPFVSTWEGYLKLDVSEAFAFSAIGRGRLSLSINNQVESIPLSETSLAAGTNQAFQLRGGLNRVRMVYESPASGDAWLRLFWSNDKLPWEPVLPTALVHEAEDAELARGETRRLGRQLFATRHCAKCHEPSFALETAMPELRAEPPSLDNFGDRFNASWLPRWVERPSAIVPEATMPACLHGSPEETASQARAIAAYLATLGASATGSATPNHGIGAPVSDPARLQSAGPRRVGDQRTNSAPGANDRLGEASLSPRLPPDGAGKPEVGADLFSKLGCIACHLLPGDQKLEGDTRRPLGHVKAKWQPQAVVEFLRAPGKYYPWTRMPDFQLSAAEAESLAAHLLSKSDPEANDLNALTDDASQATRNTQLVAPERSEGGTRNTSTLRSTATEDGQDAASPDDAQHGKELLVSLGCVNCHAITGLTRSPQGKTLASLTGSEWTTGCLAEDPARRGKAPAFDFEPRQRAALSQFLKSDAAALQATVWPEFAHQQFEALRCTACHQRENAKDFWFTLEALEDAKHPKASNPYDEDSAQDKTIHRQRPPLNWAGEKLRPEWMEQLFLGRLSYKPRPKLEARMPAFPAYAHGLAQGLALDHGCATTSPDPGPVNSAQAKIGQALIQKGALGCVDCHAIGSQPALAGTDTATINFAHIPERLRKEYFERYVLDPPRLLPGTMMPRFSNDEGLTGVTTYFEGDARKQFEAIWQYMKTVRETP